MVREKQNFNGTVEFRSERDDYIGNVSITDGWVQLEDEYIPRESVSRIVIESSNPRETM